MQKSGDFGTFSAKPRRRYRRESAEHGNQGEVGLPAIPAQRQGRADGRLEPDPAPAAQYRPYPAVDRREGNGLPADRPGLPRPWKSPSWSGRSFLRPTARPPPVCLSRRLWSVPGNGASSVPHWPTPLESRPLQVNVLGTAGLLFNPTSSSILAAMDLKMGLRGSQKVPYFTAQGTAAGGAESADIPITVYTMDNTDILPSQHRLSAFDLSTSLQAADEGTFESLLDFAIFSSGQRRNGCAGPGRRR